MVEQHRGGIFNTPGDLRAEKLHSPGRRDFCEIATQQEDRCSYDSPGFGMEDRGARRRGQGDQGKMGNRGSRKTERFGGKYNLGNNKEKNIR